MMKYIYLFASVLFILTLGSSCKNQQKELQDKIQLKEKAYSNAKEPKQKMQVRKDLFSLIDLFEMKYPRAEKVGDALFLGSQLAMDVNDVDKALEYLNKIHTSYANHPKIAEVTFAIAVFYDGRGDVENARKFYDEFITKYPNDKNIEIAKSAKSILGKNIEEMVAGFENQGKGI